MICTIVVSGVDEIGSCKRSVNTAANMHLLLTALRCAALRECIVFQSMRRLRYVENTSIKRCTKHRLVSSVQCCANRQHL